VGKAWRQPLIHTDGKPQGEVPTLTLSNRDKATQAVFVTVLEAYPAAGAARVQARVEKAVVTLEGLGKTWRIHLPAEGRGLRVEH
jgi:hypothetical protein